MKGSWVVILKVTYLQCIRKHTEALFIMGKYVRLPECSILKDLSSQLLWDDLQSYRLTANKISK